MNLNEPLQPSAHLPVGAGHALAVGATLEDFQVTQVLGLTRVSALYLATRASNGDTVVIKEYLPSALADRQPDGVVALLDPSHALPFQRGLESFAAEALTLSQFDHPNLLRVHCVWEGNGTIYRAMPQINAKTLLAWRVQADAPASQEQLHTLMEALLGALRVLHDAGLAHLQVEPGNLLMPDDAPPVLMDFDSVHQAVTSDIRQPYVDAYADPARKQKQSDDLHAVAAVLHFAISCEWHPAAARYAPLADVLARLKESTSALGYQPEFLGGIDTILALPAAQRPQTEAEFRALFEHKPAVDDEAAAQEPTPEPPPAKPARPPKRPRAEPPKSEIPTLNASESVLALLAKFDNRPSDGIDDIEPFEPPQLPTLTEEAEPALPPLRENPFDTIEARDMHAHDEENAAAEFTPLPYRPMPRTRAKRWQRIKLIATMFAGAAVCIGALGWVLLS